jgi:hypothetical protein
LTAATTTDTKENIMSLKKIAPLPKPKAPKAGTCHKKPAKPAKKAPRRRPIAR